MYLEETKDKTFEIKLSQQEIDRCAKILLEFSLIEKSLGETKERLNTLMSELANLTQHFLH